MRGSRRCGRPGCSGRRDACTTEGGDGQVLPKLLGQEGNHGRDQLGGGQKAFVERPIGVALVGVVLAAPEAVAAAADVPVAQGVDELDQPPAGVEVVVLVHLLDDRGRRAVQLAEDPAVQFASLPRRAVAAAGGQDVRRQLAGIRPPISAAGSKPSMLA